MKLPSIDSDTKVKDLFLSEGIDLDFIDDYFEGAYWEEAGDFLSEVWLRTIRGLTPKQNGWLVGILDTCIEKRIELQKRRH